jgi:hypothetical protein
VSVAGGANTERHVAALAARGVWDVVWPEFEQLIAATRSALASHFRDTVLAARRLKGDGDREIGELVIGRSHLRVECPLRYWPPTPEEPELRDLFGDTTPLVRILVRRSGKADFAVLESALVADPARGVWVTTAPALGPASLGDRGSLETFFWSLISDRRG